MIAVNFIPFYESWFRPEASWFFGQVWINRLLFGLVLTLQAVWFQRVIHNARFFDQWSIWPWVVFMLIAAVTPAQFLSFRALVPNFIWLIFYQKLFYHHDRELSNLQIHMDAGILFCVGVMFYPRFALMLPFLIILLNQFAVNDLNRFYLVIFSFLMLAISTIAIAYLFISEEWVMSLPQELSPQLNLELLKTPSVLYSYLTLFVVLVVLTPLVYNRLGYMQTQNRTVINMLYLQVFFALMVGLASGSSFEESLLMVGLPLAFIISFGSYHLKVRWLSNILLLLVAFTLVLVQWTYMRDVLNL